MKPYIHYIITASLILALAIGILGTAPFPISLNEGFATESLSDEEEIRELNRLADEEISIDSDISADEDISRDSDIYADEEDFIKLAFLTDREESKTALLKASSKFSDGKSSVQDDTLSQTEQNDNQQSEQTPGKTDTSKNIITGFEPLDPSLQTFVYAIDEKPSLNNLLKLLPKTLDVYLDQSSSPVSIPVIWYCVGDNYKSSDLYYFQFSPVFGDDYQLASYINLLKDAPYILVSLTDDQIEISDSLAHMSSEEISANEQKVYRFLTRKMGFNAAAACGIMANIRSESNFNPTFSGDNGTSYGICQWRNERKTGLINWCRENNHKYNTISGQLYYLKHEISQNDPELLWNGKNIYNKMLAIEDTPSGAYSAGYIWCRDYEHPFSKDSCVLRGNIARNEFWKKYGNDTAPASVKKCRITISRNLYNYSGNPCTPAVKVKSGNTLLKEGADYRVAFSDNTEPGTASVTITGIGDYTGSRTLRYTIRLKTPEIISITNKVTGIRIDWKTVPGASGYYVLRRREDTKWTRIGQLSRNTASYYIDRTAEDGVEYIYSIRAYTSNSRLSDYDRSGESISRLTRPTIYSRSNEVSAIKLKWDAVDGAEGYIIYRSVNNGKYSRLAKVDSGLSYLDTSATEDGTAYQYRVRAYSDGQTGAASQEVIKVRMSRTRITATSNPVSGQLKVDWKENKVARGYQVQYSTDSNFPKGERVTRTIIGSDNLSITIDSLPVKTRYYVRARTYIKTDTGTYFSEWSDVKQQVVR